MRKKLGEASQGPTDFSIKAEKCPFNLCWLVIFNLHTMYTDKEKQW